MRHPMRKIACLISVLITLAVLTQCGRKKITAPLLPPDNQADTTDVFDDRVNRYYQTTHFQIHYPSVGDSGVASEMAQYVESVYDYVDAFYCGNAPETITQVYLTQENAGHFSVGGSRPDGIYLYVRYGTNMKQIFAHEFGHATFYRITNGRAYNHDFINEGASVIIEKYYEAEAGFVEPWDERAYWASQQNIFTKENLTDFQPYDFGSIGYAIGYSFVLHLRETHGAEKMVDLMRNLPYNTLGNAFQYVSLDYNTFYDDWMAYLTDQYNANAAQLSPVPTIQDSLMIDTHEDGTSDVRVKINVRNGESSAYRVYFSYYIGGVGGVHAEPSFQAYSADFETIAVIGENIAPGTEILYDAVVSSNILMTWIKSGWKRFNLPLYNTWVSN